MINMSSIEIPIPEMTVKNGPEIAYGTLLYDLDGLRELDEAHPIIGSFKVKDVPGADIHDQEPPASVRTQWPGVEIPVRFPSQLDAGHIEFTDEDAVLSLIAKGRFDAAR